MSIDFKADWQEFLLEEEDLTLPRELPRERVKRFVNDHCRQTGKKHGLVWKSLYRRLRVQTGYCPPESAPSKLLAVEAAGYIEELLELAMTL